MEEDESEEITQDLIVEKQERATRVAPQQETHLDTHQEQTPQQNQEEETINKDKVSTHEQTVGTNKTPDKLTEVNDQSPSPAKPTDEQDSDGVLAALFLDEESPLKEDHMALMDVEEEVMSDQQSTSKTDATTEDMRPLRRQMVANSLNPHYKQTNRHLQIIRLLTLHHNLQ